jgi:hypothetical protein
VDIDTALQQLFALFVVIFLFGIPIYFFNPKVSFAEKKSDILYCGGHKLT